MSTALGRERELRTGISLRSGPSSELEVDKARQEVDASLLEKLRRELDDKHVQVRLCGIRESLKKMKTCCLKN